MVCAVLRRRWMVRDARTEGVAERYGIMCDSRQWWQELELIMKISETIRRYALNVPVPTHVQLPPCDFLRGL